MVDLGSGDLDLEEREGLREPSEGVKLGLRLRPLVALRGGLGEGAGGSSEGLRRRCATEEGERE